jgi:carbon-monoxide dehydrogenase small subunit
MGKNQISPNQSSRAVRAPPEAARRVVEGLAKHGHLHPVQQCFLEGAALQCGVCTPGFLVAAKALLEKHPSPSEHDIRFNLANNLCRCTGYDKIVKAVQAAAHAFRSE